MSNDSKNENGLVRLGLRALCNAALGLIFALLAGCAEMYPNNATVAVANGDGVKPVYCWGLGWTIPPPPWVHSK